MPAPRYARCVVEHIARGPQDLTLEEQDIVMITAENDGLFFGECNSMAGWFPASCVSFDGLEDDADAWAAAPDPQSAADAMAAVLKAAEQSVAASSQGTEPGASASAAAGVASVDKKNWFVKYKLGKGRKEDQYSNNGSRAVSTASSSASSETALTASEATLSASLQSAHGSEAVTSSPLVGSPSGIRHKKQFAPLKTHGGKVVVSVVGAPAESRKTWVEHMGGDERVKQLLGDLSAIERKRQEVIFELITTERDYVEDLKTIIDVFMKPLSKCKMVRPKDMSVIFSNIEALLPVNQELLRSLEERQKSSENGIVTAVGDIFVRVSDFLKMYTMYCSNHTYATIKLQTIRQTKSIARFIDSLANHGAARGLALPHFLLKPIQRICKYPLLIRELLKQTPESHPDATALSAALLKVEAVVTIVNDAARQAASVHKMLELQSRFQRRINFVAPCRSLKKSATVEIVGSGAGELHLFSDILVVAKTVDGDRLKLISMVGFEDLVIYPAAHDSGIEIRDENAKIKSIALISELGGKDDWLNALKESIDSWVATKGTTVVVIQQTQVQQPVQQPSAAQPIKGAEPADSDIDTIQSTQTEYDELYSPATEETSKTPSISNSSALLSDTTAVPTGLEIIQESNFNSRRTSSLMKEASVPGSTAISRRTSYRDTVPPPLPLPPPQPHAQEVQQHAQPPIQAEELPQELIKRISSAPDVSAHRASEVDVAPSRPISENLFKVKDLQQATTSASLPSLTATTGAAATLRSPQPQRLVISNVVRDAREKLGVGERAPASSVVTLVSSSSISGSFEILTGKRPPINKPVAQAAILDVHRTQNNFVYSVAVQYVNAKAGEYVLVNHTFDDFFELHLKVLGQFPEEAGLRVRGRRDAGATAAQRIIPELPHQMVVVGEAVARARMITLNEYLQCLVNLPAKISRSPLFMEFLRKDGKIASNLVLSANNSH